MREALRHDHVAGNAGSSASATDRRSGAATPLLLALVSIAIVRLVWGAWTPWPLTHDEAAYVLQAEIFASGRWSAPSPPLDEFFEQAHVLVTPVLAAKYPPGHSLLLAIGALIGWTALIPLLLTGVAAALVYLLATRLGGPGVGLLTWWIWTTSPHDLYWRVGYFSELTTSAILLVAWWLLMRWHREPSGGRLALLALVIGWGAITRPWTMLALTIPIAFVVVRELRLRGTWRQLGPAIAAGLVVLAIWPLWSLGTLGTVERSPHGLYTQQYIPWDRIGFGLEERTPARTPPPDVQALADSYEPLLRRHTPAHLGTILVDRAYQLVEPALLSWRAVLLLFAGIGLTFQWRRVRFPVVSAGLLLLAYLAYGPHPAEWTLYYLEVFPVAAILAALGISVAVQRLTRGRDETARRRTRRMAFLAITVGLFLPSVSDLARIGALKRDQTATARRFARCLRALPPGSGVFVRYAETHNFHHSFIRNVADLQAAPRITALDRGPDGIRLANVLPDRAWYRFDERDWTVRPWPETEGRSGGFRCPSPDTPPTPETSPPPSPVR